MVVDVVEVPEILLPAPCCLRRPTAFGNPPLHYCHSKGPNPVSTAALPWDIDPR
jgi:hypothetical protein